LNFMYKADRVRAHALSGVRACASLTLTVTFAL
jgi:hypothetical protein